MAAAHRICSVCAATAARKPKPHPVGLPPRRTPFLYPALYEVPEGTRAYRRGEDLPPSTWEPPAAAPRSSLRRTDFAYGEWGTDAERAEQRRIARLERPLSHAQREAMDKANSRGQSSRSGYAQGLGVKLRSKNPPAARPVLSYTDRHPRSDRPRRWFKKKPESAVEDDEMDEGMEENDQAGGRAVESLWLDEIAREIEEQLPESTGEESEMNERMEENDQVSAPAEAVERLPSKKSAREIEEQRRERDKRKRNQQRMKWAMQEVRRGPRMIKERQTESNEEHDWFLQNIQASRAKLKARQDREKILERRAKEAKLGRFETQQDIDNHIAMMREAVFDYVKGYGEDITEALDQYVDNRCVEEYSPHENRHAMDGVDWVGKDGRKIVDDDEPNFDAYHLLEQPEKWLAEFVEAKLEEAYPDEAERATLNSFFNPDDVQFFLILSAEAHSLLTKQLDLPLRHSFPTLDSTEENMRFLEAGVSEAAEARRLIRGADGVELRRLNKAGRVDDLQGRSWEDESDDEDADALVADVDPRFRPEAPWQDHLEYLVERDADYTPATEYGLSNKFKRRANERKDIELRAIAKRYEDKRQQLERSSNKAFEAARTDSRRDIIDTWHADRLNALMAEEAAAVDAFEAEWAAHPAFVPVEMTPEYAEILERRKRRSEKRQSELAASEERLADIAHAERVYMGRLRRLRREQPAEDASYGEKFVYKRKLQGLQDALEEEQRAYEKQLDEHMMMASAYGWEDAMQNGGEEAPGREYVFPHEYVFTDPREHVFTDADGREDATRNGGEEAPGREYVFTDPREHVFTDPREHVFTGADTHQ